MTRMTISRAISWLACEDPDRVAVRDDDRALTRRELDLESNALARAYAGLGVGVDDLVTVTLPNTVEFVVACVAIWKLGATPQPLSWRLPLEERRAIVELADSALVVGAAEAEFPGRASVMEGFGVVEGFRSSHPDEELPDAAAACWKAPTSSGSTGTPKIVLAAASAHVDPQGSVAEFVPREAVQLVAGPLYHSAPFTYAMRGLMTGHSLVLLPKFDERRVLAAIGEYCITWMMLVPTMMRRITMLPEAERLAASVDSLESILHLGAPCDQDLKHAWIDWLGPSRVVEVYVGSESSGITMITGDEWLEHPGSVGRPIGGSRMRVVGADGEEVAPGEVGRIEMARDGGATYRYLGRSTPTDEWQTLGDLGRVDADGYLWVLDREDDLIVSGSVKVYPIEIERVLERHPDVRSAVAFGVPDDDLGARIHALVDIGDSELSEHDLRGWLRGRIDPEKAPRTVELVSDPVRDDAGKARRGMLARERSGQDARS